MNDLKPTFKAGSVIAEKFEIIKLIGEGSLGDDIYLGKQTDLDRAVKIRILPKSVTDDIEMVDRFNQEIQLTASLQHPNILATFETGGYLGRTFFVTAAEKGVYLNEYLSQRGQLEEKEAVSLIIPLADALSYAWDEKKILHRNVKPDTILIARDTRPILEDFGMAKSFSENSTDLTMAGFTIGNPEYMSPEQVKGDYDLDFRSDMYCLGLVFYEMLTGHHPFQGKNSQIAMMEAHLNDIPRPVQEVNPFIKEACSTIVDRMLKKDKEERFKSWNDLINDLEDARSTQRPKEADMGGSGGEASQQHVDLTQSADQKINQVFKDKRIEEKEKQKKLIMYLAAGVIGILIIIIVLIIALGGSGTPATNDIDEDTGVSESPVKQVDSKALRRSQQEMWEFATTYAEVNPDDHDQIIRNYQKIIKRFPGTKYEMMADTEINKLKKALESEDSEEKSEDSEE